MSSLTRNGERCHASRSGTHWSTDVSHYNKTIGFSSESAGHKEGCSYAKERPSPEGAGSGGDSRKAMCQRTNGDSPYKSYNGQLTKYDGHSYNLASYGVTMLENVCDRTWDKKTPCCDKCSATLVALKKQALTLAVHHHLSSKELSDMSAFLRDNLRVHSTRSVSESKDKEQGSCAACGVHLSQLKQEAIHLALSREQARWRGHSTASLPRQQTETKSGGRASTEKAATLAGLAGVQHHSRPQSPRTPQSQRTPQTPRRRSPKAPNPDMGRWVEEQQHINAKFASKAAGDDGVAVHPYQTGHDVTVGYGDGETPRGTQRIPHISRVAALANSVAISLLTRAAQKLNLSRKKGLCPGPGRTRGLGCQSTCFRSVIQKSPPPAPPSLLQAAMRTRDSPNTGQVKVVLRVGPSQSEGPSLPAVLRIEPTKKRVIVMDAVSNSQPRLIEGLKTFTFDAAYPQESSQAEVCAGVLADVIRCVVSGSDGCVLGLGCADVGCWATMAGSDEGPQTLGLMPCAVSWLYSAVERRREKTWTDMAVSVSAVELCYGQDETLRDLLAEVAPSAGSERGNPVAQISLHDDPIYGIQLCNHNRVKAPNAERAASLLDAAIAARLHGNQARGGAAGGAAATPLCHSSVMFFTVHVQPLRTDIGTLGRVSRGPVKLTMIDVYSSVKGLAEARKARVGRPHSELGPVILSILSGHKDIPSNGSKLTMLFKAAMGHMNCSTTVIAQVSDRPSHHLESLSTIQLASRICRTHKRTKQSAPCSPCGRSPSKDRNGPRSLSLRSYHSTGAVHVDVPRLRLRCDFDERSSSDQSCDTVIHIDSEGSVQKPKAYLTRMTQPEFVPIIPSLHPCTAQTDDPEFTALLKELLNIPRPQGEKHIDVAYGGKDDTQRAETKPLGDCLKCDTFAELQERLGCIDFTQLGMGVAKMASKEPNADSVSDKPQSQRVTATQGRREPSAAPQTLLSNQTLVGVKQGDGAFPGDTFQREDSGLYDCEDCSAASSSEEPPNQTLTLNRICQADRRDLPGSACAKTPDILYLVNCEMAAQSTATPHSLALAPKLRRNQGAAEVGDHRKPQTRTSPVGKSSPISPCPFSTATSDSSSPSLTTSVMIGDILPQFPTEDAKEMKATITVTFQQPLDQTGQDELVFSMVEEVTISGTLDRDRKGRNVISFKDGPKSQVNVQGSVGSLPVRIIGNVSEESGATDECSKMPVNPAEQVVAKEGCAHKHFRREARILPSFINPTLIHAECNVDVESSTDVLPLSEPHKPIASCPEKERENRGTVIEFSNSTYMPPSCQTSYDKPNNDDTTWYNGVTEVCVKRQINTDRSYPREKEHVCPSKTPRGLLGGEISWRIARNTPESVSASSGCLATAPDAFKTASLPRCWHRANNGDHDHKYPWGVTSSTPCSPRVTLERRKGAQHSSANYDLQFSPPRKHSLENRKECVCSMKSASGSLYKTSSLSERPSSPVEDSSRLFSAKLEHLSCNTNCLGRTPVEFQSLDRGSSSSVNSKGSSKGSFEGNCKRGSKGCREGSFKVAFKESYDDDSTIPRVSRGPRKTPEDVDIAEPGHQLTSSHNHPAQSPRCTRSKLSAVGKLKMASPKVRRLSAPSSKSHSFSQKGLQQHSINRSASLSPEAKALSPEQSPSYLSSSPPWSLHSASRTSSQSSNCPSTKSLIQGVFNGRFSDLMNDRDASPSARGPDKTCTALAAAAVADAHQAVPSPYSRVTAPRAPSHMSGYGSDATSVLSGELPPAMGKTALLFPNRGSVGGSVVGSVGSSGYESMVRDSEATGSSSASTRDSVSDRSSSLISLAHSSHTSRRRGNAGSQPRRLPCGTPSSVRRSVSGPRARWVDGGIPESYQITVYEIDDVERMQRRAGASKKGPGCFSAKLMFLEHRQQRISEVRAKYYNLKRELEQAKQNLMLEPGKWNQDFDLWQTFEVDSLEHLEALESITTRLESKLNLCKANVMMVTCFDVSSKKRRQKKRCRAASGQLRFLGI